MTGLHLDDVVVEGGDLREAFLARGGGELGVDAFRLVKFVLGGDAEVFDEVPFLLERVACGDVYVLHLFFLGLLDEGVEHPRVVELVEDDLVHELGELLVALHPRAVFDELIARARLAFAGVGAGEVEISFAVFQFHDVLRWSFERRMPISRAFYTRLRACGTGAVPWEGRASPHDVSRPRRENARDACEAGALRALRESV